MSKQWAGILSLAALVLSACSVERNENSAASAPAATPQAVPVIIQQVALEPEQVRLEAVGTSRARRSVTLYPASAGEVTAVNFTAGQRVEQGEVLLELDARDEKLAVDLARVRLDEAQRLYRRYLRSQDSGAVTASDLDAARTAVESTRIELDRAEVALADRTLEAPFSGHVGATDVEPGARIDTGTRVTTLDDRSSLLVRFEVPENLVSRIVLGEPVSLATWQGGEPVSGRIVDIDSRIDPVSRTFVVRAEVPNPDDRLRPGMSFRVSLALDGAAYPVVPEVAVQWGGEGSFVWQVVDGKATRVPVTIVQRRTGRVLVDAVLPDGALVVKEGVQRMREGTPVSHRPLAAEIRTDG